MVSRLMITAGLVLSPGLALAAGHCQAIAPELIVTADVQASMAVIEREETCSLVLTVMDTTAVPAPFGISLAASPVHGEVSITNGLLHYSRTTKTAESETLPIRLLSSDGRSHGATLIIRMPAPAAGS